MRYTHRYKLMQVSVHLFSRFFLVVRLNESSSPSRPLPDHRYHHQDDRLRSHGRQERSSRYRSTRYLSGSRCESQKSTRQSESQTDSSSSSYDLQGIGSALSTMGNQVSSQACVPHQDVALAIASLLLWSSIGASIGSAVSVAVRSPLPLPVLFVLCLS